MSQHSSTAAQHLDALAARVTSLNTRRMRAQVQLETSRKQYSEAVQQSVNEHETSNLDELRAKLIRLEAENVQAIADFTKALDDFEKFLARIEAALADPEVMATLIASMEAGKSQQSTPVATAPETKSAPAFNAEDI